MVSASNLNLNHDGAELAPKAAADNLAELFTIIEPLAKNEAGLRITDNVRLQSLLSADGCIGHFVAMRLPGARAVRALLFDKSPATNWALGWHQDRTIAVKERVEAKGFGPWTVKQGIVHVAPPIALLERMITIRVHLDDVPDNNAPLIIAPGSHKFGLVAESEIDKVVSRCGTFTCTAVAGDIWLCATPVLHASDRAEYPEHRRVLQVDYSADDLPNSLEWQGV